MPGPRCSLPVWDGLALIQRIAAAPDERYIRLGSGLDAQDAAPIRGIARGMVRKPLM